MYIYIYIEREGWFPERYEPRKWVLKNYGNEHSGRRLLDFVKDLYTCIHVELCIYLMYIYIYIYTHIVIYIYI